MEHLNLVKRALQVAQVLLRQFLLFIHFPAFLTFLTEMPLIQIGYDQSLIIFKLALQFLHPLHLLSSPSAGCYQAKRNRLFHMYGCIHCFQDVPCHLILEKWVCIVIEVLILYQVSIR